MGWFKIGETGYIYFGLFEIYCSEMCKGGNGTSDFKDHLVLHWKCAADLLEVLIGAPLALKDCNFSPGETIASWGWHARTSPEKRHAALTVVAILARQRGLR